MPQAIKINSQEWSTEPNGISIHDVATTLMLGHAISVVLDPYLDVRFVLVLAPLSLSRCDVIAVTRLIDDDFENFGGGGVVRREDAFGEDEKGDEALRDEFTRIVSHARITGGVFDDALYLQRWFELLWKEIDG